MCTSGSVGLEGDRIWARSEKTSETYLQVSALVLYKSLSPVRQMYRQRSLITSNTTLSPFTLTKISQLCYITILILYLPRHPQLPFQSIPTHPNNAPLLPSHPSPIPPLLHPRPNPPSTSTRTTYRTLRSLAFPRKTGPQPQTPTRRPTSGTTPSTPGRCLCTCRSSTSADC